MPTTAQEVINIIMGILDFFGVTIVIVAVVIVLAAIAIIQRFTDKG